MNEERLAAIEARLQALESSATIPLQVEDAFRDRLKINELLTLSTSTKTGASETQAVSEAGIGAYNVAKPMDGFKEAYDGNGAIYYIPYYT